MYTTTQLYSRTDINVNNIKDVAVSIKQIVHDWDYLVKLCGKYPVELCFTDNRYVYGTEQELRNILEVLLQRYTENKLIYIWFSADGIMSEQQSNTNKRWTVYSKEVFTKSMPYLGEVYSIQDGTKTRGPYIIIWMSNDSYIAEKFDPLY